MSTAKAYVRRTTGLTLQIIFVRLLSIVYVIIVARILSSGQRTEIAALLMFLTLASNISLLSLHAFLSAVIPRKIAQGETGYASGDFKLVSGVVLTSTVITSFVSLIISVQILTVFYLSLLPEMFMLFGIVAVTLIPYNLLATANQMLLGLNRIKHMAVVNTVNAIGTYIVALGLIFIGIGTWGVIIGWLIASLLALAFALFYLRDVLKLPRLTRHSLREIWVFSWPLWFAGIFLTINGWVDQYMVLSYLQVLDPFALGNYYYAVRIVQIAISVLGAITITFRPLIAEASGISEERTQRVFNTTTKFSVYLTGIFMVGMIVFSNTILVVILGIDFLVTSYAFQVFSVATLLATISGLLAGVFSAEKKTFVSLYSAIFHFIVAVSVGIIIVPYFANINIIWGMAGAALASVAGYLANLTVFYAYLRKETNLRIKTGIVIKCLAAAFVVGSFMWVLSTVIFPVSVGFFESTIGQFILMDFPVLIPWKDNIVGSFVILVLLLIFLMGAILYLVILLALRSFDQKDFDVVRRVMPLRFGKVLDFIEWLNGKFHRSLGNDTE